MKATKNQIEAQNIIKELVKKATTNESFKERLINYPQKAIDDITGKKGIELVNLHGGSKIVVEDQTDSSSIFVNIPAKPNFDNFELSDEELESVSGGCTPSTYFVVAIGAAALGYATK